MPPQGGYHRCEEDEQRLCIVRRGLTNCRSPTDMSSAARRKKSEMTQEMRVDKPNIIIVQTDQQSWSTLALYGNPVLRTPALEALASRGVVFERAYCNYPACAPSRSSMMTGRYASTIRNQANHMRIDPREITLPGALKAAGYETALIGKNHAFLEGENYYPDAASVDGRPGNESGRLYDELHRTFDFVFEGGHVGVDGSEDDPELAAAIEHAREKSWGQQHQWSVNPYPAEKSVTHRLTTEAVEFVSRRATGVDQGSGDQGSRPFFLWFSIPDPHTPYQVSEPYASMFDPSSIPPPIKDSLEGKPERQMVAKLLDFNDRYDDGHFQQLRAIHYGMIRQIDDNLARFFAALDEAGLSQTTIVVFLSDHGDAMGDHGIIQKQNFFYDSITRVPFIVSWPGSIEPRRTGELVELVDVMPTVLDLAGVEIPGGVQGSSLRPFLTGHVSRTKEFVTIESGEYGEPMTVAELYDENGEFIERGTSFAWCAFREAWVGRGVAIRTQRWKLCVYENGDGELYDMERDPNELANLYSDTAVAGVRSELFEKLVRWQIAKGDTIPANPTVAARMHYRPVPRY